MTEKQIVPAADGIVVATGISAGGVSAQHAEGIVVSTAISAGGVDAQHAEGLVARAVTSWRQAARPLRRYSAGGTSAVGASA